MDEEVTRLESVLSAAGTSPIDELGRGPPEGIVGLATRLGIAMPVVLEEAAFRQAETTGRRAECARAFLWREIVSGLPKGWRMHDGEGRWKEARVLAIVTFDLQRLGFDWTETLDAIDAVAPAGWLPENSNDAVLRSAIPDDD